MNNPTLGESGRPDPRWALLLTGLTEVDVGALPNIPETTRSSLYVTDLANVQTADEFVALIRNDFSVPGPMGGLDAVLSRLSDIDWAPNPAGYVWQIRGLPSLRANDHTLFRNLVGILVLLLDREKSASVPYRILVHGDAPTLEDMKFEVARKYRALRENRKRMPWIRFEEPTVLEWVDGGWRSAVLPD